VIRLHTADRHKSVAILCDGVGDEVLKLSDLVAAEGEAGVAVLALGVDLYAATEMRGEPLQFLDRRRAEHQLIAREFPIDVEHGNHSRLTLGLESIANAAGRDHPLGPGLRDASHLTTAVRDAAAGACNARRTTRGHGPASEPHSYFRRPHPAPDQRPRHTVPSSGPVIGPGLPKLGEPQGRRSWQNALPEGLVALCNHAECGISVHFAPLIASCRLRGPEPSGGAHHR
jgi:hypothetical protein